MHHDVFGDDFPFYFCRDCNDSFYDDQKDDQLVDDDPLLNYWANYDRDDRPGQLLG